MNTPQVNYPYQVIIEAEKGIPAIETFDASLRVTQLIGQTTVNEAGFGIEYNISQGVYVKDSRTLSTRGIQALLPTSRTELGFVGPIWSINIRPLRRDDEVLAVGNSSDIESDFRRMNVRSPFADQHIVDHIRKVYPWLTTHHPYTGNLWMVAYGDSDETGVFPARRARIFERNRKPATNPYSPPDELTALWGVASALNTEARARDLLDITRQITVPR